MYTRMLHEHRQKELQHRLNKAHIVFEFCTLVTEKDVITTEDHRNVIKHLFDTQILPKNKDWLDGVYLRYESEINNLKMKNFNEKQLEKELSKAEKQKDETINRAYWFDIEQAIAVKKTNSDIKNPRELKPYSRSTHSAHIDYINDNWFIALYKAFNEPPYSLKIDDLPRNQMWLDFCECVGLEVSTDLEIFDWIQHCTEPTYKQRANNDGCWSNYFYAGFEWWGVWCLTVYNPRKKTLSCLVASTSD